MPSERELLKKLTDSLNKQPQGNSTQEQTTQPQQEPQQVSETTFIPLRNIDDILKEQSDTNPKKKA